jgi:dTDP-4-amino-4,6-dideoxygalactose transaminase
VSKRIFLSPPHMSGTELEFVRETFAINFIAPLGPMVEAFEQEFSQMIGIPHVVALSSGTAAMHLALQGLDVGPGDEVLASTLTFIGSISPAVFLGARPIFIDADRATWNMNPDLLAEEMAASAAKGKLPKAVIPTDLYGQCADLDRILEVCAPYNVPVVVDSAEALGATYKGRPAGVGAKASIYSFNGNKIITTGGGGMLASNDAEFIRKAKFRSQQARNPAPHYEHSEIGYNYRMSSILAAIGRGQLQVLQHRVAARRRIFERYRTSMTDLPGIEFMPEASYGQANRWLTVALITPRLFGCDREALRLTLENADIEARPVWKPMHLQPVFRGCRVRNEGVAEDLFDRGICLPSGTLMTESDLERVIKAIRKCHSRWKMVF